MQGVWSDVEQGQRDRQFETTAPGTARVEIQTVTTPFDQGLVRVAGDDELDGGVEVAGDVGDVVGQQGLPAVEVEG